MLKFQFMFWFIVFMFIALISFLVNVWSSPYAVAENGTSITGFDKNNVIHVKFVAENKDKIEQESFPGFLFDPAVGDYVQGFSGSWYVITRRQHDWSGRRARSSNRFIIFVDRCDEPKQVAEADCSQ